MKTIELSRGYATTVDDSEFETLSVHKWSALVTVKNGSACKVYATRAVRIAGKNVAILMHRHLLNIPPGCSLMVDHRDGDSLNNQRSNLRLATYSQNNANRMKRTGMKHTSRFKGVGALPTGKWRATIKIGESTKHLGVFLSEEDAARAYDDAAREQFGEYALLNLGGASFF